MDPAPLDLTVRVGCRMSYDAKEPTAALFMIKPRRDEAHRVSQERFSFHPSLSGTEYQDEHDNIVRHCFDLLAHLFVAIDKFSREEYG